jgi:hypothetical protein
MSESKKPISVHPQVATGGIAAVIAGAVFANLAWFGVTVPPDVIAADTAALALVVEAAKRLCGIG